MSAVFAFIDAERASFPVLLMCRVLDVSKAGFYAWLRRGPSKRERRNVELLVEIDAIHEMSNATYGARRVAAELRHRGIAISRGRVERLMRRAGLSGLVKRKKGKTTIRVPGVRVATDLVERDFSPTEPNKLWVADITYVRTWEGWLYLAAVIDCYSRRCVGWAMGARMRAELVVDALQMAVARRRPEPGLVHHSDQGSQYVSLAFGQNARDAGIDISMGSRGDAYDNAVAESFFSTLKKEKVNRESWPMRLDAELAIFKWIEGWYNTRRLHSTLGYVSPTTFEETIPDNLRTKETA